MSHRCNCAGSWGTCRSAEIAAFEHIKGFYEQRRRHTVPGRKRRHHLRSVGGLSEHSGQVHYVNRRKSDAVDAASICDALTILAKRLVVIKAKEEKDVAWQDHRLMFTLAVP